MNVFTLSPVRDFIEALDPNARANMYTLIDLLETYGHALGMPVAKPIGHGLWELRSQGRPAMRILYGFCSGRAVLVLAFKKQRPAISPHDNELAQKRLAIACSMLRKI